jgi:flagellar assembly factor FliW
MNALITKHDVDTIVATLPQTPEINTAILNTAIAIIEAVSGFYETETPGTDMAANYERFKEIKGLPEKINKLRLDGLEEIRRIEKEFKAFVDSRVVNPVSEVVEKYRTCIDKYDKEQAEIKRKEEMERLKAMTKPKSEQAPIPVKQSAPAIEIKKRNSPYTYAVVDIEKVPTKYKKEVPNDVTVKLAIKAGVREIEGLKIYRESKIV